MLTLNLNEFNFEPTQKVLYGFSEPFGGDFPSEFSVRSHHTGRTIKFKQVKHDHLAYSEDGWDGEACVYEPVSELPNVKICILTHAN